MSHNKDGLFSANLLNLQLQTRTLFEGIGGDYALRFMDALCKLSGSEQKTALESFTKVILQVSAGEKRYFSPEDQALQAFEEDLYQGLVSDIENHTVKPLEEAQPRSVRGNFAVYDGGRRSSSLSCAKSSTKTKHTIDKARQGKLVKVTALPRPTLVN